MLTENRVPATLSCRKLSKSFGPVEVLGDVSLDFRSGEIHAIIGENGAGKSTLMKILAGHAPPSSGSLAMDGKPVAFGHPASAEQRGIVLVHQEILLAQHLTAAQNIFLGRELRRGLAVDDRAMYRRAAEGLRDLGADISPRARVEDLSIAQRQLVQIARALLLPQKVVIFDEPTASLTPVEANALLKLIAAIKIKGVAVLYVSHRLREVKAIADRVSVLRDGRLVETRAADGLQPIDMARMMVGREMSQLYPQKQFWPGAEAVLEVDDLDVPGFADNVSFRLHQGEILGFAGLVGAGRTDLFEGLMGLRPAHGNVRVKGQPLRLGSTRAAFATGMAYLSEDRKGKGLLLQQDLCFNLTLAALAKFCNGPFVDRAREKAALWQSIDEFDIRARDTSMLAGQLSGGNQQKLLLAKMLLLEPGIIIIDEPTRGVDIGAKQQIFSFIAALAAAGKAVVVISSDMPELIGLCHRVLVMNCGRIAGEVAGDAMREDEIVLHATGVHIEPELAAAWASA